MFHHSVVVLELAETRASLDPHPEKQRSSSFSSVSFNAEIKRESQEVSRASKNNIARPNSISVAASDT